MHISIVPLPVLKCSVQVIHDNNITILWQHYISGFFIIPAEGLHFSALVSEGRTASGISTGRTAISPAGVTL